MSPGQLVCNVFKNERPSFDRYRRPRALAGSRLGLGFSGRRVAPRGGGVAVPAIEIEFAGGRSYRNPGSGVAPFAGSLWFRPKAR